MSGRDTVELALGGIGGVLPVVVGYGATLGDFDAATLGIAILALVVVVAAAAVGVRRSGDASASASAVLGTPVAVQDGSYPARLNARRPGRTRPPSARRSGRGVG